MDYICYFGPNVWYNEVRNIILIKQRTSNYGYTCFFPPFSLF